MSSTSRVFISYAGEDIKAARALAEGLMQHKVDVWLDALELTPGQAWQAEIARAVERANAMVVLVTPHSVKAKGVQRDIEYALSSKRFAGRLIPVVLGEGQGASRAWLDQVPWVLKRLNMVSTSNVDDASKRVAEALGLEE